MHISIDALRPDYLTPTLAPTISTLIAEGASTMNARTDFDKTQTLPNHHSQLTGRPVSGLYGHGIDFNVDRLTTVHAEHGAYVPSVFDVVHDHGLATSAFVSKAKLEMLDRNWNETTGAPDVTGVDDGTDKIDNFLRTEPNAVTAAAVIQLRTAQAGYLFVHLRTPDTAGHATVPDRGVPASRWSRPPPATRDLRTGGWRCSWSPHPRAEAVRRAKVLGLALCKLVVC